MSRGSNQSSSLSVNLLPRGVVLEACFVAFGGSFGCSVPSWAGDRLGVPVCMFVCLYARRPECRIDEGEREYHVDHIARAPPPTRCGGRGFRIIHDRLQREVGVPALADPVLQVAGMSKERSVAAGRLFPGRSPKTPPRSGTRGARHPAEEADTVARCSTPWRWET